MLCAAEQRLRGQMDSADFGMVRIGDLFIFWYWFLTRNVAGIHSNTWLPFKLTRFLSGIWLNFDDLHHLLGVGIAANAYFTIVTTFMIYLIGHLETVARQVWLGRGAETTLWQSGFVGLISLVIPDMNSFTIVDEILAGNRVPWAHTFNLLGYAGVYLVVILALSEISFRYREL